MMELFCTTDIEGSPNVSDNRGDAPNTHHCSVAIRPAANTVPIARATSAECYTAAQHNFT